MRGTFAQGHARPVPHWQETTKYLILNTYQDFQRVRASVWNRACPAKHAASGKTFRGIPVHRAAKAHG